MRPFYIFSIALSLCTPKASALDIVYDGSDIEGIESHLRQRYAEQVAAFERIRRALNVDPDGMFINKMCQRLLDLGAVENSSEGVFRIKPVEVTPPQLKTLKLKTAV